MEIIKQRERVHVEKYALSFMWNGDKYPGAGFSFDCDKDGNVFPLTNEAAQENYDGCISGKFDVRREGVVDYSYYYTSPKEGKCHCGRIVQLDHFTNTCDCGADYNSSGTLLADRSQWGEETGEHLSDIMRIP
jgi:hypothetical protein